MRQSTPISLVRAPWVVPVVSTPIADGGVLFDGNAILAVGPYADLRRAYGSASVIDLPDSAVTPFLVNAHTHLELSFLDVLGRESAAAVEKKDFPEWITDLLDRRAHLSQSMASDARLAMARAALARLFENGVGLAGDIGNSPGSQEIASGSGCRHHFFHELIGLATQEQDICPHLERAGVLEKTMAVPHAPYSVSPSLISHLAARARRMGVVCSIHAAESPEETEFLLHGSGPFAVFFSERGLWRPGRKPLAHGQAGPVAYLDFLGALAENTLLVHCVQVSDDEIGLMKKKNVRVCLCPGSNRVLGVGRAPLEKFLATGIMPALGTDSLASNDILDLWQEMDILRQDHPGVEPKAVFAMATLGGGRALGDSRAGFLGKDAYPEFLAISLDDGVRDETMLYEYLTTGGPSGRVQWLCHGNCGNG